MALPAHGLLERVVRKRKAKSYTSMTEVDQVLGGEVSAVIVVGEYRWDDGVESGGRRSYDHYPVAAVQQPLGNGAELVAEQHESSRVKGLQQVRFRVARIDSRELAYQRLSGSLRLDGQLVDTASVERPGAQSQCETGDRIPRD